MLPVPANQWFRQGTARVQELKLECLSVRDYGFSGVLTSDECEAEASSI